MQAFIGVIAALAGILLGYLLRHAWAKNEKAQAEQRMGQLAADLSVVRAELGQALALADGRAGFESLAAEREKTARQLTAERDGLRTALQEKFDGERILSARISALEAELRSERQNMAEKLELLETAKTTLAHQFQVLAGEVLDTKAKSFAETSRRRVRQLRVGGRGPRAAYRERKRDQD